MSEKFQQVIKRDGAIVPFKPDRISHAIYRAAVSVDGRDKNQAELIASKVLSILYDNFSISNPPAVEQIQDIVEKVLIEEGHAKVAKAYIVYRHEQSQKRKTKTSKQEHHSGNVPYQKIYETLVWAVNHDLHSVESLNNRIKHGEFATLVTESDDAYENDIQAAAKRIVERRDDIRIVVVAGPSSSGKTTTTRKLSHYLNKEGLGFVELNIDHYFFDLEMHPVDEFGDHDFETPQALDLDLINTHIKALLDGEEVLIPHYNFKTGKRTLNQTPMKLGEGDIILIDSLHGLYGKMLDGIAKRTVFKTYIETLLQMKGVDGKFIRWTDLRLMRRMLRDEVNRGYDPIETLTHWHYVRSAELRHIIPYISTADYLINGAVPYELPVMANRLLKRFKEWEAMFKDNKLRVDAYLRAKRVRQMLETITPVEDESPIPPTSHFREFIGGSTYDVH